MENEERTPCVEGKGLVEDLDQLRVDGTRPQGWSNFIPVFLFGQIEGKNIL